MGLNLSRMNNGTVKLCKNEHPKKGKTQDTCKYCIERLLETGWEPIRKKKKKTKEKGARKKRRRKRKTVFFRGETGGNKCFLIVVRKSKCFATSNKVCSSLRIRSTYSLTVQWRENFDEE